MFSFIAALLLAGTPQTVVEGPVQAPVLPTGPLVAVSATRDGGVYVAADSVTVSDIPGRVRGDAVLVTAGDVPLRVVTVWIDCVGNQFQLDSGRQYDASGQQVAVTAWERDQPIPAGTGVAQMATVFCKTGGPDLSGLPVVVDWRAALAAR